MNIFRKFISGFHRILGVLLCLLFFMWFASGIVMIYHSFPRASQEYKLQRQAALRAADLLPMDSLMSMFPDTASLQSASVEMRFDRPAISMRGKGVPPALYMDDFGPVEKFDEAVRLKTLQLWCSSPILKIDTLEKVDQWIPFGGYNKELQGRESPAIHRQRKPFLGMGRRHPSLGLFHVAPPAPDALD